MYLLNDPENRGQTLVETFDDSYPFNHLETKVIPFNTEFATFSVDRRSIEEQTLDSSIYIGLSKTPN